MRLPIDFWTAKVTSHFDLISPIADAFIKRRAIGASHPVHDFLFTYYNCSPTKLKQWVPSIDQSLETTPDFLCKYPWFDNYCFNLNENILSLNEERLNEITKNLATFVAQLCDNILERTPKFGCYGLHEWAMVYKISKDNIRHNKQKLRIATDDINRTVETQKICCSHYDAYRFFTNEALPFNQLNPTLETRLQFEQGGCVHANMDLYKWSSKLWPWIGSDFLAKTFFLALKARELDMRASPYDLTMEGFEPIYIETDEGRRQYQKEQQLLTAEATPLRKELSDFCKTLVMRIKS